VIERADEDPAFTAQMLLPPTENEIALAANPIDPDAIHGARVALVRAVGEQHGSALRALYDRYSPKGPFSPDARAAGERTLRNATLRFITAADNPAAAEIAFAHYKSATNMTDMIAGLGSLTRVGGPRMEEALADFHNRFQNDPLVLDKWMGLQAMAPQANTVERVRALMKDPAFSIKNPNRVRALVGAFANANPLRFHDPSGAGYRLLREVVLMLDVINPATAARMVTPFETWRRYDARRQALIRVELEAIAAQQPLSPNLYEIVMKILGTS
jgi:aminopeptidase N